MLLDARTGVGTYARSLHRAIGAISAQPGLLIDRADVAQPPPEPLGKIGRLLRATWPLARQASHDPDNTGESRYRVPDLFRLAQVFLDIHRRSLAVRLPGPPGIAHWSYPLPVHVVGWHNVYTIHDLIPLSQPAMSPIEAARHRLLLEAVVASASGIVTVSEASRAEIAALFGSSGPLIGDCGQPVDVTGPIATLPATLARRGYFLVLGSVETRKNVPTIIAAHRLSGTALPLVIVGPDGWGAAAIGSAIDERYVIRLPYAPGEMVRALLASARGLIMASLAEGFGLPVAEAMALGTPVITSDRGALSETAGGAALLVDPSDERAIASAITRLDDDQTLWGNLRDAGLARADAFSLSRFVTRLATFYDQLAPLR